MTTFDITPEERASAKAFFKRQLFRKPPYTALGQVDLAGKTAIVTGSNIGLGLECSRQLLDLGLTKLIIAVRSESKGQQAKKDLLIGRAASTIIEVWSLDLCSYDSITTFAERTKTLDRLDIVVHNAGIVKANLEINESTGHEECTQVNYLSLALLSILLLPILKEKNTAPDVGRLVLVSSDTAAWAAFKERDSTPLLSAFDKPEYFDAAQRYWASKLLGQLFLKELAERVPSSVAVINAPNPGWCYGTGLNRENGGLILNIIKRLVGRSSAVGARALVDAAVNHGPESHGHYLEDGKRQPMAPLVYASEGEQLAKKLWKETMAELAFAKVEDIVIRLGEK
ncbi:hypothetical protein NM208_g9829 [Fusarium decemcellulare]|uniref:Uncharacterized protein n=1 Tax=Fusarium decemcellulare TaxID=57161 RepID=A0ACC1S096_9HYPO|nr:hypothetical protein NM208_g9829 [Fusarium decemcellulare]